MESEDAVFQPAKRFRKARGKEEEKNMLQSAIPKSTRYKNKWAVKLFEDWKSERNNKYAIFESSSLNSNLEEIENLDEDFIRMKPPSLNFWVGKFIQEVVGKDGKRFPGPTLYQIVAGLKRYLEEYNRTDVNMLDKMNTSYSGLRRILDAEMKLAHKDGIVNKKEEKEGFSDEEEEKMWKEGHLGMNSAKSLLNTIYYYNGKLFGLRASEHRMLRLSDVEVSSEFIRYKENTSKTFHGGIKDLKKKPRIVKHICHKDYNKEHERCLCKIYKKYFELVEQLKPEVQAKAFYFQPFSDKLAFKNCVVGIHSLGDFLPNLCQAIGSKRKTSHSLRVTCASKLFNNNVEEKLIRDRTGHVSNALFQYEKSSSAQEEKVSNILGPVQSENVLQDKKCKTDVGETVLQDTKLFLNASNDFDDIELPSFDFGFEDVGLPTIDLTSYAASGPAEPKSNTIQIDGRCNVTINNYN